MRYYLAFRRAIPQQKVGSCRSSPVCHWFDLAISSVRLACLRYTASIHPEPGSNSQLKLNFKRHSLPLFKWQKNSIKYAPSAYLAASLVKELRYCTQVYLRLASRKTTLQKRKFIPSEHEHFTTYSNKSSSQPFPLCICVLTIKIIFKHLSNANSYLFDL